MIKGLTESAADDFDDPVFATQLIRTISRDYSIFLSDGFEIEVNAEPVRPHPFNFLVSKQFEPMRVTYKDEGVQVEIIAGMSDLPPEDLFPDDSPTRAGKKKVEYFGWFVACNDRVVLAGDKSNQTVWGDEGFQRWHPQYNGFLGMVKFNSDDPMLLPWTTTKRGIDRATPLYRRAVGKMKEVTQDYIDYTTARRGDAEKAEKLESAAKLSPIRDLKKRAKLKVPTISPSTKRSSMTNIAYVVPRSQAREVATALGDADLSNKKIGESTFRYYRDHEAKDQ